MKKKFSFMLIFISFILLFSCGDDKEKTKIKSTDNVDTIFAVNTTKVILGEINDYIELNGDIKSKSEVAVYPDTMGKLVSLLVNIGDNVYKGQVLAQIDPSKPGMDYALNPVRSPITGTITEIPVQIGETVTQQSAIVKVGKLDKIEIITYVAEKFVSKIKVGLNAIIKLEAFPGEQFKARVVEASPIIDPQTRMMVVKLGLIDSNNKLRPGMFAKIKIITEKKDGIVKVPAECIIKRYGQNYVFVVQTSIPKEIDAKSYKEEIINNIDKKDKDTILYLNNTYSFDKKNKYYILKDQSDDVAKLNLIKILKLTGYCYQSVEKRKVNSGIQIDEKVEILEGLNPDEEIVIRGQTLLEDKTKVKVIDQIQALTKNDVID